MSRQVPREGEFVERYVNRAEARRRFGSLADRYARFYLEADPVADALAANESVTDQVLSKVQSLAQAVRSARVESLTV